MKILLLIWVLALSLSCGKKRSSKAQVPSEIDSGSQCVTPSAPSPLDPDEEWVLVPENAGGMSLCPFYVMKFEARAISDLGTVDADGASVGADHLPVSIPSSLPWRGITGHDSATRCEERGEGYRLISNNEWIAISRSVESNDSNWNGGSVGEGCMHIGNSGDTTVGDGTQSGDSCGYNGPQLESGSTARDIRASLELTNGEKIYDLAGNLWEWVDWDKTTPGYQGINVNCSYSNDFAATACPDLDTDDFQPLNTTFTSAQGMGYFYGNYYFPSSTGYIMRGGSSDALYGSGVYSIQWTTTGNSNALLGFRCVYSPES